MKKNLAVIFGGRSSEHEVSCVSVVTIAKAVDLEKYNMFLIGITKDGEWKLVEDIAGIEDGSWKQSPVSAIISPDTKGGLIISQDDMMKVQPIDVIFPVWHVWRGWNDSGIVRDGRYHICRMWCVRFCCIYG